MVVAKYMRCTVSANYRFFACAFSVLILAAAFDAFVAIALRCSGDSDFARASPPRFAIADKYFEIADRPIAKI